MREDEVSAIIQAPIDAVWNVLIDVERMPEWTSSMRSVRLLDGPGFGRTSRARIKQPWLPVTVWTVELFDPPRLFAWRSRMGLVETLATHLLEDRGAATYATCAIRHSGAGAAMAGLLLGWLVRRYVNRELDGLKARAERRYQ